MLRDIQRADEESLYRDVIRQRLDRAVAGIEKMLSKPIDDMEIANTRGLLMQLDRAVFEGFHIQHRRTMAKLKAEAIAATPRKREPLPSLESLW